jgi:5-formyltetrahydrofolate cyclo-ligase
LQEKSALRKQMKEKIRSLSAKQKNEYDAQIAENLYALPVWQQAETIGITISRENEINTKPIIEKAWQEGKTVCVPKCDPQEKTMTFRAIRSFDQLESVYFGLQEPIVAMTEEVASRQIDVMIVPGVCFSKAGYRIGYGGGYYDRYLQHFWRPTISLAYSFQVVNHVPFEAHDIPVDMIVTNEKVMMCDE